MDAVILAAGLGTRLRPHTLTTPKPLLPVQGRPILDWTLGALPRSVTRVIVVAHYLAEQVEAYMAGQRHFADYAVVPQGEPRGTGDALRKCQGHVRSDSLLVLNGDDLYGAADLRALAACAAGILAHPVAEPEKYGIIFPRADGTLDRLVEKPKGLPAPQVANVGAYAFPRSVFDIELQLSSRGEYEITDYVSQLASRAPFRVVECRYWFPIGTEEAWIAAQKEDLRGQLTA